MFKEGKSIEEIAQSRQFATSTIEGHLAEYVKKGLLQVEDLMDSQKVKFVREFMIENPTLKGSELKMALGEKYSYNDIRMVSASMNELSNIR